MKNRCLINDGSIISLNEIKNKKISDTTLNELFFLVKYDNDCNDFIKWFCKEISKEINKNSNEKMDELYYIDYITINEGNVAEIENIEDITNSDALNIIKKLNIGDNLWVENIKYRLHDKYSNIQRTDVINNIKKKVTFFELVKV
jgi:hypothetical protein